jgi:tetratricopeptide (TPR) repeat protein
MFSKIGGKGGRDAGNPFMIPGMTITAIIPINEEKTPVDPAGSVIQSTSPIDSLLFNRQPVITYTTQLAQAKLHSDKEEIIAARKILRQLTKKFPDYPEAFVELADSFSKTKNPQIAVVYYNKALELAPFDIATKIKCTRQLQELSKTSPQYAVKLETLTNQLTDSRELKAQERAFRAWYHSRLRNRFKELEINVGSALTKGPSKSLDYQDISLSNGAAADTFLGLQAWAHDKYIQAEYYFEKAIIKFEHDFIAWSCRAYCMLITDSFVGDELQEVTKIIDKYNHSLAYFTRFRLYCASNQDDLAYQDLASFLCDSDHPELTRLMSYRESILKYMIEYSDPGGEVNEEYDTESAAVEVMKIFPEIISKKFQGDTDRFIKILTKLIRNYPEVHTHYCTRALFYEFKGDFPQANTNFSIAIWLADLNNLSVYFYHRARVCLAQGDIIAANEDFDRALIFLRQLKKDDWAVEEVKVIKEFAMLCLTMGKEFCEANKFESAEPVFNLGIGRALQLASEYPALKDEITFSAEHSSLLVNLYSECAKAMRSQGRDLNAIRDYIFHGKISYMFWNPKSSELMNKKYNYYQKLARTEERKKNAIVVEKKPAPAPHKNRRANFFNSQPPRTKSYAPITRFVLPGESVIDFSELQLGNAVAAKQEKPNEEKRKLEKRLKEKAKKLFRLQQRKHTRPQGKDSSSDSEVQEETPVQRIEPSEDEIKAVSLDEFESKIFTMIYELVPEELRKNFKIYLGGGWAYDKIRLKMLGIPVNIYNDFDLIGNIPGNYLEKIFTVIPEVDGLYSLMMDEIKIDYVYEPDIDNLDRIARSRAFLTLYIDETGKVHDRTGFGLIYMRNQRLYSSLPPSEIFKDNPLSIFLALYQESKRNLYNPLKQQIKSDSVLLVPRLLDPVNNLVEKNLHPKCFNIRLGKLFSQHLTIKNFEELKKYKLLEVLFPDICDEIYNDIEWVDNQIFISNIRPFPKISIIYTSFIATAIAQRVPVLFSPEHVLIKTEELVCTAYHIYENSLLFKHAYKDFEELMGYLQRTLLDWSVQHEPPEFAASVSEQCIPRFGR